VHLSTLCVAHGESKLVRRQIDCLTHLDAVDIWRQREPWFFEKDIHTRFVADNGHVRNKIETSAATCALPMMAGGCALDKQTKYDLMT
jgi:hypothetical protein